jgi:hypothetical protein
VLTPDGELPHPILDLVGDRINDDLDYRCESQTHVEAGADLGFSVMNFQRSRIYGKIGERKPECLRFRGKRSVFKFTGPSFEVRTFPGLPPPSKDGNNSMIDWTEARG